MSKKDEAAEAYAQQRCEEIQKRRDENLQPYTIRAAIIKDFGVAWVQGQEAFYQAAYEKARYVDLDGLCGDFINLSDLKAYLEEQK